MTTAELYVHYPFSVRTAIIIYLIFYFIIIFLYDETNLCWPLFPCDSKLLFQGFKLKVLRDRLPNLLRTNYISLLL